TGSPRFRVQGSVTAPITAPPTAPAAAPSAGLPAAAPIAAPPAAPRSAPLAARSPGFVPQPATNKVAANPAISIVVRMVHLLVYPLLRAITHQQACRFRQR